MNYKVSKKVAAQNRFAQQLMTACLGSLLIGALGATGAAAESFDEAQRAEALMAQAAEGQPKKPSISGLLETMPVRPTVAQPAIETPAEVENTAPAAEPATEPAVEAADTQMLQLRLSLSEKRVYVYRGETVEVSYPVAVGRPGWETPTGEFEVFHRLEDPGWTNPLTNEVIEPGPYNPLGERWMAFWTDGTDVIGFHGTPNRESVGTAASHGCIRMYNEDVKALYEIVALGTTVVVEP